MRQILRVRFLVLLAIFIVILPLAAQDNTDPDPDLFGDSGIGDPYFPMMGNGGYDVQQYDLDFTVVVRANQVDAVVTIIAEATQDLSRFNLDFDAGDIDITAIMVNGEDAEFDRVKTELVITPAMVLNEGELFTTVITYEGTPGWGDYNNGILLAGQPISASRVFPVNEHPLDKALYTFEITVDDAYIVATNGIVQEPVDNGDGTLTYTSAPEDPMASYLVTIGIGDFEIQTDMSESGVPVRNYFATGLPQTTIDNFARQAEMIDYFETLFGPYPFEVYGSIVHDVPLNFALETQTLSIFGSSFNNEGVVVHELVHQWFGDAVSVAGWEHLWLNEGFASYGEVLWIEYINGEDAANASIRSRYEQVDTTNPPLGSFNPQSLSNLLNQLSENTDFEEEVFTQAEAEEIITLILDDALSNDEINILLETLPDLGIDGDHIAETLRQASFDRLILRLQDYTTLLYAIDEDEQAEQIIEQIVARSRAGDPTPQFLFSTGVYQRGALTLHALRLEIGDDAFFETLRTYVERFKDSNATTQDFIDVAEEISGQELSEFFDGWLYADTVPAIPELSLSTTEIG